MASNCFADIRCRRAHFLLSVHADVYALAFPRTWRRVTLPWQRIGKLTSRRFWDKLTLRRRFPMSTSAFCFEVGRDDNEMAY